MKKQHHQLEINQEKIRYRKPKHIYAILERFFSLFFLCFQLIWGKHEKRFSYILFCDFSSSGGWTRNELHISILYARARLEHLAMNCIYMSFFSFDFLRYCFRSSTDTGVLIGVHGDNATSSSNSFSLFLVCVCTSDTVDCWQHKRFDRICVW